MFHVDDLHRCYAEQVQVFAEHLEQTWASECLDAIIPSMWYEHRPRTSVHADSVPLCVCARAHCMCVCVCVCVCAVWEQVMMYSGYAETQAPRWSGNYYGTVELAYGVNWTMFGQAGLDFAGPGPVLRAQFLRRVSVLFHANVTR